ncbi:MAG: hypothetical protein QXR17_01160 [Candidatus Bathyarchaeia archaeon]
MAIISRLSADKKGLANVLIVILSLVLVTVIVSNVILWSYQMNQFDWERMQEKIELIEVCSESHWFTCKDHAETTIADGVYKRLYSDSPYYLSIQADLRNYPADYIASIIMEVKYRITDASANWALEAYNILSNRYDFIASLPSYSSFNSYVVSLSNWQNYVTETGILVLRLYARDSNKNVGPPEHSQGKPPSKSNEVAIDLDFLGIKVLLNGTLFVIRNSGAVTAHIVSIWINNVVVHKRYEADIFINPGEKISCIRGDIQLPAGLFTAKVVTDRGNIAVFTNN